MVYDKAKWHSDGNFPKGLPSENGGTHIGIFLAWAINHGMAGPDLVADAVAQIEALRLRQTTGRSILFRQLDGVLSDEDLNDDGNAFAAKYYKQYMGEYDRLIRKELPSAYHAADDWQTYDRVAEMIDRRHAEFRQSRGGPRVV
jgi:hypothetical protein